MDSRILPRIPVFRMDSCIPDGFLYIPDGFPYSGWIPVFAMDSEFRLWILQIHMDSMGGARGRSHQRSREFLAALVIC